MATGPLLPLTGYAEQLSGRPGDQIDFKISSQLNQPVAASLVRVCCADPSPQGPGVRLQKIDIDLAGPYPPRSQPFYPGSYAVFDGDDLLAGARCFHISVLIAPFLLPESQTQTILSLLDTGNNANITLSLVDNNQLTLSLSGEKLLAVTAPLRRQQWLRIEAMVDLLGQSCELTVISIASGDVIGSAESDKKFPTGCQDFISCEKVVIAAGYTEHSVNHFNGKIEAPRICRGDSADGEVLLSWDFSKEISSTRIVDTGPGKHHGQLHNFPARAMTGANWDGSEMNWTHAPWQYGAIHFHQDDIVDFGWQTDFSFTIPDTLDSGAYAVQIESGEVRDWIPFFVCAPKRTAAELPKNKLCILVSTFTYAIYGNHARPDFTPEWIELSRDKGGYPWNPAQYPDYGLSTYNNHIDGSGICHASHKRPLLTLRPGYITFPNLTCSGLRHYQADSHLLYWLEQNNIGYDLITDRQLHDEGVTALNGYDAVCTGTHPEYHTRETLDALTEWRKRGGNFIYLGGNGFYWKVALHTEDNDLIEIRRAEGGIRAWAAEAGEYYQAFDGAYGGLWRRNGRPPQQLAGIGFSAQGTFHGSWYRRTPISYQDPELAFIFAGIEDEILGDFGLCGGGAAGFELDRYDPNLGSDESIKVLASSGGHGDEFTLVPEERLTHITNWPGVAESELIRADMIYQRSENGGRLFATGSITFCGSLLVNGGDNNISTLLKNVITEFIAAE